MSELPSGVRTTTHGRGEPVTLVAHGLGATEGEARIPASGLPGTRVVVTLPGHGSAPDAPADYWRYSRIADDLSVLADETGATRAVGVSLGAGALTHLAARCPDRFERLALLLPASLDQPRTVPATWVLERLAEGVDAASTDDGALLRERVGEEIPPGMDVGDYVERRASALLRLGAALRALPGECAVDDAAALHEVRSPVLVVAATDDPLHPTDVAKSVGAAFGNCRTEVIPSAAPLITHRRELRTMLVDFLR